MKELIREMGERFNLQDIKSTCFMMSIEYDDLLHTTKTEAMNSIVEYCLQTKRIPELTAYFKSQRGFVDWNSLFSKAVEQYNKAQEEKHKAVS